MNLDKLLIQLSKDDLNDGLEAHFEYFAGIEFEKLKSEPFFQGDGLDFIRYLIKYTEGIPIKAPRPNRIRGAVLKYIKKRIRENPGVPVYQLCRELQLDERTIRKYFREIKKQKVYERIESARLF